MGVQRPFVEQWNEGAITKIIAAVTLAASYAAGGLSITAADLGMAKILGARVIGVNTAGVGLMHVWNTQTSKLMAIFPTGGAEDAPTTLADPGVADEGTGGESDTFTLTPGVGKEVAATADLSGVVVTVEFSVIA